MIIKRSDFFMIIKWTAFFVFGFYFYSVKIAMFFCFNEGNLMARNIEI